jgi:hypothetical protein
MRYQYDTLDLRDLGRELNDLREEKQAAEDNGEEWDGDEDRFADLENLEHQIGDDLQAHGRNREPLLIAQDGFEEYAREYAEDIGAISRGDNWPVNHIDWQTAAEELENDYEHIEFDGSTWLIRST